MSRFSTTATKRALTGLAAAFVATSLLVLPAAAQSAGDPPQQPQTPAADDAAVEWKGGWSYGGRGTLTLLRSSSLDTGLGFSGFAVLPLSTDFEIEGEIGYQTMSTTSATLPGGQLSVFPLRATLRLQLYRFGGAKPYVGAGAGLYINRFTMDQAVLDALAEQGFAASANVEPGVGFHAGGGIEWQSGPAHFGFDIKYVFGETDATATLVELATSEVFRDTSKLNLDGFWIAGGARFSF